MAPSRLFLPFWETSSIRFRMKPWSTQLQVLHGNQQESRPKTPKNFLPLAQMDQFWDGLRLCRTMLRRSCSMSSSSTTQLIMRTTLADSLSPEQNLISRSTMSSRWREYNRLVIPLTLLTQIRFSPAGSTQASHTWCTQGRGISKSTSGICAQTRLSTRLEAKFKSMEMQLMFLGIISMLWQVVEPLEKEFNYGIWGTWHRLSIPCLGRLYRAEM